LVGSVLGRFWLLAARFAMLAADARRRSFAAEMPDRAVDSGTFIGFQF
jgi:hypothetical protein